jgi:hypothetical protein
MIFLIIILFASNLWDISDPNANANSRGCRRRNGAAEVPEVAAMGIDFDM